MIHHFLRTKGAVSVWIPLSDTAEAAQTSDQTLKKAGVRPGAPSARRGESRTRPRSQPEAPDTRAEDWPRPLRPWCCWPLGGHKRTQSQAASRACYQRLLRTAAASRRNASPRCKRESSCYTPRTRQDKDDVTRPQTATGAGVTPPQIRRQSARSRAQRTSTTAKQRYGCSCRAKRAWGSRERKPHPAPKRGTARRGLLPGDKAAGAARFTSVECPVRRVHK